MSPTINGLQNMLDICQEYGKDYDVLFNPIKTKCMKFSKYAYECELQSDMKLCGQTLSWVKSFKYLGNWVSYDLSDETEIHNNLGAFYGGVNNLYSSFKDIDMKHISILFNSYCCHFYGSQAWRLGDKNINRIFTAWNKGVRHLCKLPCTTHTAFLPFLVNTLYVKEEIYLRSFKTITNMLKSSNESVNFLANQSIGLFVSVMGGNRHAIHECVTVNLNSNYTKDNLYERLDETFTPECQLLLELISISEGSTVLHNFSKYDVNDMLHAVCTE